MKETDLYPPIKTFLEKKGFTVKGEVQDCDIVAVKEELTVVIELKTSINLTLILQAIERKTISDDIYIAVPNTGHLLKKQYRQVIKLLKLLGVGLLLVEPSLTQVTSVLEPCEYKPQKRKNKKIKLLNEFNGLIGDPNIGGSGKTKGRMTAYRQKAIMIAGFLIKNGTSKASLVKKDLNEPKARDILYANYYGWFKMEGKGLYSITSIGETESKKWQS